MPGTHVVTNQVPPLEDFNPASSPVLTEALIREGGEWGLDEVAELGALSGSRQAQRWGELADRNQPILRTHDRYGIRIDEVEYDPACTPHPGPTTGREPTSSGPPRRRCGRPNPGTSARSR